MRDNALQSPIASICTRLAAMKTGDRPRRDTGVIDDWDDNDSPCLLALREGAKLGDDQPLDLVFSLWDFFHDTTMTDFYCDDVSRVAVRRSRSIRPLKPLSRCRSHSAPARWPASRLLRRRSPEGPGRGVDYSIALVKRLSAFFIMLIGFEWVCPRLAPGT
jgi:hypothetical protein